MVQSKISKSKRVKFFIKDEEGIFSAYSEFFEEIKSRSEALVIALRVLGEIHNTLKEEARLGSPLFIGNMKVITGLQRTLNELEKRYPFLMVEMRAVPRRIDGHVLEVC